jgi:sugar phosphate permease
MKELTRMIAYTVGAVSVIFIMIWLTRQEGLSGNFMVFVAAMLIIVIPITIGVVLARRERQQRERKSGS